MKEQTSTTVVILEAHGSKKKLGVITVVRMVLGILTVKDCEIQGMVTVPKIGTILGMVTVLDIVRVVGMVTLIVW